LNGSANRQLDGNGIEYAVMKMMMATYNDRDNCPTVKIESEGSPNEDVKSVAASGQWYAAAMAEMCDGDDDGDGIPRGEIVRRSSELRAMY
jgi:hypothetical protein